MSERIVEVAVTVMNGYMDQDELQKLGMELLEASSRRRATWRRS